MPSHACAACGKSITEAALAQGTAVEHGGRTYCATCASLIVTPGTMPVVGEDVQEPSDGNTLEVLREFKITINAPDIPSPFAVVDEVVENANEGAASDMAMNDDDEWFKPRNSGGGAVADAGSAPRISVKPAAAPIPVPAPAPTPIAARPAAKASGVSSRVGMKPATPSARTGAPSGRMNSVPAQAPEPKAPAAFEPKKSGRLSNVKPAAKSASRRVSAVRMPAAEPPAPVAEVVDEPEQTEAEVVAAPLNKRGKSSRTMPAAKSSSRTSASRSKRDEREEKDSKKDKKKGGKGGDMTMIYAGVALVAVLIIGAIAMSGRGKDEETGVKKATPEEFDKTPSGTYARQAQQELSSGSRSKAVEFYTKAAQQAEREGNGGQARNYNMKAMDLIKSSKMKDH